MIYQFFAGLKFKNCISFIMVEKNIICPTCRGENVSFDESGVSWKDLQGLTWLFCEDCSNQTIDEIQKTIISYA